MMNNCVLSIEDLSVDFIGRTGLVNAVRNISWYVCKGEAIGISGESGSGKTASALAIMGLLPDSAATTEGKIIFGNTDLLKLTRKEMTDIRGRHLSMIFQETMTSLNPVLTVGDQICEPLRLHKRLNKKQARLQALQLLKSVGMASPEECFDKYPHQLSGGMVQRAMIAIAISCDPEVLVADEPVSALDPTLQQQIKNVFNMLKEKQNMALVLISHDLRYIADICDKTIIMYGGSIVEAGPSRMISVRPAHPYTAQLIECVPDYKNIGKPLMTINGNLSSLEKDFQGCAFASRCDQCMIICTEEKPPFFDCDDGHKSACWLHARKQERAHIAK